MEYLRFIVAVAIAAILAAGSLLLPEHRFDSNVVALAVFSTALALLLAYSSFRLARLKQRAASSIEEAERLATLLEHSPAALVLLDQQFQPLYINKKFRNLSRLPAFADLPITFWDERLSTVAAEKALLEADTTRKRRSEVIDHVAAGYILQGVLDRLRHLRDKGPSDD